MFLSLACIALGFSAFIAVLFLVFCCASELKDWLDTQRENRRPRTAMDYKMSPRVDERLAASWQAEAPRSRPQETAGESSFAGMAAETRSGVFAVSATRA